MNKICRYRKYSQIVGFGDEEPLSLWSDITFDFEMFKKCEKKNGLKYIKTHLKMVFSNKYIAELMSQYQLYKNNPHE